MPKRNNLRDSRILMPVITAGFCIILTAFFDLRVFLGEALIIIILLLSVMISRAGTHTKWSSFLDSMMNDLKLAKRRSLLDVPLPVTVLRKNGEIIWTNDKFAEFTAKTSVFGHHIDEFSRGFNVPALDKESLYTGFEAVIGEYSFMVYGTFTKSEKEGSGEQLMVLYWIDRTELKTLTEIHSGSQPVVCIILIDSFDELAASVSESERAVLVTKVENSFLEWAKTAGGLFRSIDRGKYMFVCEGRYLDHFVGSKFDILDKVREITIASRTPISISIGIGKDGENFGENYEFAKQAIDMALGRGGDQAVIKTKNNFEFYGGKSKGVEKRTKVKARIMAAALSDLLDRCSNVLVMGHKFADFDSIGACAGIARAAFVKSKPVNIIVNRDTLLAAPIIESLESLAEYKGVFVDAAVGQDLIESRTLLVVCDTHSPLYVESKDILDNCGTVVVIDHHRKMAEFIENSVQFYHEPYASSTCEIVTELIQYIDGSATIMKEEAEAILAGIVLDTKNFYFKTGFRTFEAAAYLRKAGADLIALKRLFKSDYLTYIRKTELISSAQFYRQKIAISIWEGEKIGNAKVLMSQAADELLNIENIDASFVLYAGADNVHISARSLGTVNVQLILEKLGGGGHLTTAGAQVDGATEEVVSRLKAAIDEYFDEEK